VVAVNHSDNPAPADDSVNLYLGDGNFDFNAIVPMPKELVGTTSPSYIQTQQELDDMWNDFNRRKVGGQLTDWEQKTDKPFRIGITKEYSNYLIAKFGADNWYNWQCSNWGTKWNANDVFISDNVISFNTAWSAPVPIFVALSEKFPEVEFFIQFADEDFGHNVGEVSLLGGDEIDSNIPDGGSEEAYLLAFQIQGESDYYTWDMLFDIEEDEDIDDNALYKVMIGLSYEENKSVDEDFPTNVLNEFLNLALADENFELATEIRDILKTKEESGEEG
jgi:hypothetical protein